MKFLHLADLHIGKTVNGYSMLEDQAYIFGKIEDIVRAEKPDAVVLAGDLYDRSDPSGEAAALLDRFLTDLSELGTKIIAVSGNHDSPEKIGFGAKLLRRSGVWLSRPYSGRIEPAVLEDAYGTVCFWPVPFLRPAAVRRAMPDREDVRSYTEAVRAAVEALPLERETRNVFVGHQFVTGGERCDSEEISVGGVDSVDGSVFDVFDYTALGHLHIPQSVGRETVRYSGSPLKYSFSEERADKSVTAVEMEEKGTVRVRTIPLTPRHELRTVRGTFASLTDGAHRSDDYLQVILTDEQEVPNVVEKLRVLYPNLMKLDYDNTRTRSGPADFGAAARAAALSPLGAFRDFYAEQNGAALTPEQENYLRGVIAEVWEEESE